MDVFALTHQLHSLLGCSRVYLHFEHERASQEETTYSRGMLQRGGHAQTRQASLSLSFLFFVF